MNTLYIVSQAIFPSWSNVENLSQSKEALFCYVLLTNYFKLTIQMSKGLFIIPVVSLRKQATSGAKTRCFIGYPDTGASMMGLCSTGTTSSRYQSRIWRVLGGRVLSRRLIHWPTSQSCWPSTGTLRFHGRLPPWRCHLGWSTWAFYGTTGHVWDLVAIHVLRIGLWWITWTNEIEWKCKPSSIYLWRLYCQILY